MTIWTEITLSRVTKDRLSAFSEELGCVDNEACINKLIDEYIHNRK